MKKQASDQLSHERRYRERKRNEAARKLVKKPVADKAAESQTAVRSSKS
jgi:hypothetical protein